MTWRASDYWGAWIGDLGDATPDSTGNYLPYPPAASVMPDPSVAEELDYVFTDLNSYDELVDPTTAGGARWYWSGTELSYGSWWQGPVYSDPSYSPKHLYLFWYGPNYDWPTPEPSVDPSAYTPPPPPPPVETPPGWIKSGNDDYFGTCWLADAGIYTGPAIIPFTPPLEVLQSLDPPGYYQLVYYITPLPNGPDLHDYNGGYHGYTYRINDGSDYVFLGSGDQAIIPGSDHLVVMLVESPNSFLLTEPPPVDPMMLVPFDWVEGGLGPTRGPGSWSDWQPGVLSVVGPRDERFVYVAGASPHIHGHSVYDPSHPLDGSTYLIPLQADVADLLATMHTQNYVDGTVDNTFDRMITNTDPSFEVQLLAESDLLLSPGPHSQNWVTYWLTGGGFGRVIYANPNGNVLRPDLAQHALDDAGLVEGIHYGRIPGAPYYQNLIAFESDAATLHRWLDWTVHVDKYGICWAEIEDSPLGIFPTTNQTDTPGTAPTLRWKLRWANPEVPYSAATPGDPAQIAADPLSQLPPCLPGPNGSNAGSFFVPPDHGGELNRVGDEVGAGVHFDIPTTQQWANPPLPQASGPIAQRLAIDSTETVQVSLAAVNAAGPPTSFWALAIPPCSDTDDPPDWVPASRLMTRVQGNPDGSAAVGIPHSFHYTTDWGVGSAAWMNVRPDDSHPISNGPWSYSYFGANQPSTEWISPRWRYWIPGPIVAAPIVPQLISTWSTL